ncbi:DUF6591 domain-containing protein [Sediminibacterium sp.]|uniref:DUF6591 domain-containing protein n=1 Tax=Sediminibacterium sp. TaxID=1917865 RepID=UPI003F6FA563
MKTIKTTFNLLFIVIVIATLIASCSGESKKGEIAKVKPEKVEISGDLTDYLQIVDNEYEITGDLVGNLSIKVKAIKALTEDAIKENDFDISASLLDDKGMPVSGTGEFKMEYTSKNKLISLLKKGSGEEVIQLKTVYGDYKAEEHAEKSKKFSVSSTMKTKEETNVSSTESSDNSSASSDVSISATTSTDCDQFITEYEEFVSSYLAILKKYKANPTDASILTEYTEMATKAATMETDASNCTDAKYAAKLMKLNTKIANAAAGL